MRHTMLLIGVLICGGLSSTLACSHGSITIGNRVPHASHGDHGHGPPPHAPAHGYRRKHHAPEGDVELAFDSELGVYVVIGLPSHYFWDGLYLRVEDGRWYTSARLDGGWEACSRSSLPPGLAKKTAKGRGRRGRGPAKGAW